MRRRTFLAGLAAAGASSALAGCSASARAPPRQSEVFQTIQWQSGAVSVTFESTPVVQSRATVTATAKGNGTASTGPTGSAGPTESADGNQSALNPVGVAAAGGRGGRGGRGGSSSGRGSGGSAAKTGRNGRKKWRSGDYDDWWDEHEDEVSERRARVRTGAIGYLGSDDAYEEDPPGAGPVEWDRRWRDASAGDRVTYGTTRQGWYRVGALLVGAESEQNFGWEAVDFQLVPDGSGGFVVDNQWKISPRL